MRRTTAMSFYGLERGLSKEWRQSWEKLSYYDYLLLDDDGNAEDTDARMFG
jgi:hypothetical protein